MPYFTQSELLNYRSRPSPNLVESRTVAELTVFLSHSHKDRDLALGLIHYLGTLGIKVYVDWNDSTMPRVTNRATAEHLKESIRESNIVLVLATKNGVESRWVPWEVGIADNDKGEDDIIIIPVEDPTYKYQGNEYLQLYRTVERNILGDVLVLHPTLPIRRILVEVLRAMR